MRMASGSLVGTSTSVPMSPSASEEKTLYNCAVGIPSKTDEKKLTSLRSCNRSQTALILDWPSVVNGVVTLVLR